MSFKPNRTTVVVVTAALAASGCANSSSQMSGPTVKSEIAKRAVRAKQSVPVPERRPVLPGVRNEPETPEPAPSKLILDLYLKGAKGE